MEDKIDWSIYSLDELILNLGESRTKLLKLTKNDSNKESIKTIECKIKQIYEKRKELFTKKEELIAKETLLKSQLDTAKMTSEHNLNMEVTMTDCKNCKHFSYCYARRHGSSPKDCKDFEED